MERKFLIDLSISDSLIRVFELQGKEVGKYHKVSIPNLEGEIFIRRDIEDESEMIKDILFSFIDQSSLSGTNIYKDNVIVMEDIDEGENGLIAKFTLNEDSDTQILYSSEKSYWGYNTDGIPEQQTVLIPYGASLTHFNSNKKWVYSEYSMFDDEFHGVSSERVIINNNPDVLKGPEIAASVIQTPEELIEVGVPETWAKAIGYDEERDGRPLIKIGLFRTFESFVKKAEELDLDKHAYKRLYPVSWDLYYDMYKKNFNELEYYRNLLDENPEHEDRITEYTRLNYKLSAQLAKRLAVATKDVYEAPMLNADLASLVERVELAHRENKNPDGILRVLTFLQETINLRDAEVQNKIHLFPLDVEFEFTDDIEADKNKALKIWAEWNKIAADNGIVPF